MATVGFVERRIRIVEGFDAHFVRDGRKVNANMEGMPGYPYENAAPSSWTVSDWIEKRFKATYPGCDARVMDGAGREISFGHYRLSTIREGYR